MSDLEERTFIAIKPDGVQRGIIGEIIKRFEMKGFKLVGMKMLEVSNNFFSSLISNALTYLPLRQRLRKGCFHDSGAQLTHDLVSVE